MPSHGVVNNPDGVNSYSGPGGEESSYGAVKRLVQSVRAAPIGKNPALNEPRRSKNRAVSGQQPVQPHPLNEPQAQPQQDPETMKAEFWGYLASLSNDPEIMDLAAPYTGNYGPPS